MMKLKIVLLTVVAAAVAVLSQGCSYPEELQYFTLDKLDEKIREYEPDMPQNESETDDEEDETSLREIPEIYYAYHALDEGRQKIYIEVLDALSDMEKDVKISTLDKSELDVVFNCVMNDHPELFYVEGYQYTEYTFGNTITGMTFSGTYSMEPAEAEQIVSVIDQKILDCFSQAPLNGDEYSIAKYFYEWIINNTDYDKSVQNNQNIQSVFLQGKSVCQGYAKAMQYMLQKADIQCLMVTGFTSGERHAWDMAKIDGEYYYIDPTWGDASYSYNGMSLSEESFVPSINYDYFLVTTDELTRTHSIEKVVELPECISVTDNYFVREGLYFSDYNEEQLAVIFDSEQSMAAGYVTIKCADDIYESMLQTLIGSQKIFDFINKQGESITYTSNDKLRTISFWNIY
jgi:hypothetical protein